VHRGFWYENLNDGDNLEDLDIDGRIILKLIFKEWGGGNMDWIYLAQDMDRLQQYTFAFHTMREIR
jgi:hypothetical protein